MIENKYCFIWSCRNSLERMASEKCYGPETERGLKLAIDFVSNLDHETMTEAELSHAVRCTTFRGKGIPIFKRA